jgi:hypothetical protein
MLQLAIGGKDLALTGYAAKEFNNMEYNKDCDRLGRLAGGEFSYVVSRPDDIDRK